MLIFGMILIWMFGREFSDRTAKDLLALPTSRTAIVDAKFAVAAGWALLLALQAALLGLLVGAALRLPGWSARPPGRDRPHAGHRRADRRSSPLRWRWPPASAVATWPPSGALFVLLFLAQIIAALGYGHVFPWSVPGVFSGIAGPDQDPPGAIGFLLVVAVGAAGVLATAAWWRSADHNR